MKRRVQSRERERHVHSDDGIYSSKIHQVYSSILEKCRKGGLDPVCHDAAHRRGGSHGQDRRNRICLQKEFMYSTVAYSTVQYGVRSTVQYSTVPHDIKSVEFSTLRSLFRFRTS